MHVTWPRRDEAAVALVCGLTAAASLWSEGAPALVLAVLVSIAAVAYRRRPLAAALGVAALMWVGGSLAGIPSESPWSLPAFFAVVYGLGRYGNRLHALIALVGFAPVFAAPSETRVGNIIFALLVFATLWTFGYLVRSRSAAAEQAAALARELAATDPEVAAARAVAEERARLAGDTVAVVRSAVTAMQEHASVAMVDLDPTTIAAIQREGRRATRELRRLLGLLRSEDPEHEPAVPPVRRRPWRGDLVAIAVVAALMAVDLPFAIAEGIADTVTIPLSVALVATVLLRRADPTLACLAAIIPPAIALALDVTIPYGMWSAVTGLLLTWAVVTRHDPRLRDYATLGTFAVVLLLDTYRHQPGNVVMLSAIIAIAAISGYLWARAGRREDSATEVAISLRAEQDARTEQAVRAERLRLARELHDVTSHSVGVMVLQAGAATAVSGTAPDQALAALRNVRDAGVRALAELSLLFGLLDAGAVGAAGHAGSVARADLAADLTDLAARMRRTGLEVAVDLTGPLPDEPAISRTTYRVVQEALTNAARYAPRSKVDVAVRCRDDVLEVTVTDDGPKQPPPANAAGSGFGLVGLEERIRSHGGDLDAGPRPDGGFAVAARIPVSRPVEVPI